MGPEMSLMIRITCCLLIAGLLPAVSVGESPSFRFATFNTSLYRDAAGELVRDLSTSDNEQARQVAEIIQRTRPDVLLLNEFDYDADGRAAKKFQQNYLAVSQGGQKPIQYEYSFVAAVNTGVPSHCDLDQDGRADGPGDAFGFGRFPGQYGMLVLSRLPIAMNKIRTFQHFKWQDMPRALLPQATECSSYYSTAERKLLRLSSKSHWDIPLLTASGLIHFLVSHPTPPVFDGDEDRNGRRNHDEIRFWADYIEPRTSGYIYDDQQRRGGLRAGEKFVIAGDMNADPYDGDSTHAAIRQLIDHRSINASVAPASAGGQRYASLQGRINLQHRGKPEHDTADFHDARVGNLRLDYVLPSKALKIVAAHVFWPVPDADGSELITASDHRLVWVDLAF